MSVRNQHQREQARAASKSDAPLENIKPERGMLVTLAETPGVWQLTDKAPAPPGAWWLTPWDAAARDAEPDREWGAYRRATYRTMKSANARGLG